MSVAEIFGLISSGYNLLTEQVFGLCGIFYPLFISGIVSMSVFFIFKSPNKSIIALIATAFLIMILPLTPYEGRLVALSLVAVSSVFFILLIRSVR